MHSAEREKLILECLGQRGFISFQDLEKRVDASPATIRRDLERLVESGLITRVRGGAQLSERGKKVPATSSPSRPGHLLGVPFHENIHRRRPQKEAIGRTAAKLCAAGEGIMIDGGSTTLQMCTHLARLNLQVLTNSLHIVSALLNQPGTRLLVPAGHDGMPRFHAPKLFMGASSLGPAGLMQADIILVTAERRLIDRADQIIVLVDSSKFSGPSGHVVCRLEDIDTVVTDADMTPQHTRMLEKAGIKVVIAGN
jgi:DeoR family transcriptional regulator, ulaG and ulaABCDEF operon transcriptional repressor